MAVTPSRAWIVKRLRQSKVMSALSLLPLPWSEHQDSMSDLPMELLGWWWSVKLNWDRCRDQLGLPLVQLLRHAEVLEVFVVCPDIKLTWHTFKEVLPFL